MNSVPNQEELLENIAQSLGIVKQEYGEYCNKLDKRPKLWLISILTFGTNFTLNAPRMKFVLLASVLHSHLSKFVATD